MANLKEIRTRISSVKSTRQITSAMKMVSAAKLRKAQQSLLKLRPYADKIHEIMGSTGDFLKNNDKKSIFNQREMKKVLIIVISSNRGLCGAFNSYIVKKTISVIDEYKKNNIAPENIELLCYGKSASKTLLKMNYNVVKSDFDIIIHF